MKVENIFIGSKKEKNFRRRARKKGIIYNMLKTSLPHTPKKLVLCSGYVLNFQHCIRWEWKKTYQVTLNQDKVLDCQYIGKKDPKYHTDHSTMTLYYLHSVNLGSHCFIDVSMFIPKVTMIFLTYPNKLSLLLFNPLPWVAPGPFTAWIPLC